MKRIIGYIGWAAMALIFCAAIYFAVLGAKHLSYELFYQDLVEQTVRDMVKPEYLKDK